MLTTPKIPLIPTFVANYLSTKLYARKYSDSYIQNFSISQLGRKNKWAFDPFFRTCYLCGKNSERQNISQRFLSIILFKVCHSHNMEILFGAIVTPKWRKQVTQKYIRNETTIQVVWVFKTFKCVLWYNIFELFKSYLSDTLVFEF